MWKIEWDEKAVKEAKKLDKASRKKIVSYLEQRIATADNPRQFGKPLLGNKSGLWRYRVSDYRIICSIEDNKLTVLVVAVGHRKNIYSK
jgi:mRNA interferase RelE/StbE